MNPDTPQKVRDAVEAFQQSAATTEQLRDHMCDVVAAAVDDGLSQSQIALIAGVQRVTVKNWITSSQLRRTQNN